MDRLTTEQRYILDYIVEQQLQNDTPVTGRRIRADFAKFDPKHTTELLQSLVPKWLISTNQPPQEIYRFTLEGVLASASKKIAIKYLGEIQRLLKQRFTDEPDFKQYTFGELRAFSTILQKAPFRTIDALISTSEWLNGGGGSPGSDDYRYGTPLDIERIIQSKNIEEYVKTRQEVIIGTAVMPPTPAYLTSEGVLIFVSHSSKDDRVICIV